MFTTLILALLLIASCSLENSKEDKILSGQLDSLIENKSFFKLKSFFETNLENFSTERQLYYGGLIDHFFNNAALSNQKIKDLLAMEGLNLCDSNLFEIYKAKRMNHINLYEYKDAVKASEFILEHFQNIADSANFAEYKNEHKIWLALKIFPNKRC